MGKRLVRTDKNGTQYWVDDRCPKCGGTGFIQCYYDGGICYQCGGSGYWKTSWKVYTPEYQAKLDERRRRKTEEDKANAAHIYSVVVGSFGVQANATRLSSTLAGKGYTPRVVKAATAQGSMFRVVATSLDTKGEAAQSRATLEGQYPGAWLLYQK